MLGPSYVCNFDPGNNSWRLKFGLKGRAVLCASMVGGSKVECKTEVGLVTRIEEGDEFCAGSCITTFLF